MDRVFYFLVYMVFFVTPLEAVAIFEGYSIVKVVTIVLLLVTFLNNRNVFKIREPFIFIFFIYTILILVSDIWSIDKEATLQASLKTVLPSFIVTLIIYNSIREKIHLERIFMAYVLGCAVVSVIALYVFTTDFRFIEGEGSRVTVLGQDQNELSFLLSFGIVSAIYLLKYLVNNYKTRILLFSLALVYAFVILTTGSRMGLILIIIIVATLTFVNLKSGKVFLIVSVILILGIVFLKYLPSSITERHFQTLDQIRNHDLTGRVAIWKMGLLAFDSQNAYILGTGFHTFQSLLESKFNWSASPHNTYLCTFIELGILGSLIFLVMIGYLLGKVYYLVRNISFLNILLILPLLTTMFVLGTNNRRWLFLIGVIIIKIWEFAKTEVSEN